MEHINRITISSGTSQSLNAQVHVKDKLVDEESSRKRPKLSILPCRKVLMVLNKWRAFTIHEMTYAHTTNMYATPVSNASYDSNISDANDTNDIFLYEV
jgi:hypothetical protein